MKVTENSSARKIKPAPEIVGSWNLIILKGIDQQGRIHYPYDKIVKGFAVFDDNNYFSVNYFNASRPLTKNNDPFYCSDAEIRISFLSCYSSFGRYKVCGDSLNLYIVGSAIPNETCTDQRSYFKTHKDTLLIISDEQMLSGVSLKKYSIWLRSKKAIF